MMGSRSTCEDCCTQLFLGLFCQLLGKLCDAIWEAGRSWILHFGGEKSAPYLF